MRCNFIEMQTSPEQFSMKLPDHILLVLIEIKSQRRFALWGNEKTERINLYECLGIDMV